jgi:hypothetical protein
LVYDNAATPEDIADLLPTSGARIVVTSRFLDWSDWATEMPLDVFPLADASSFLEARAGRHDGAGAEILAETLGRLPLALDHAAAYCKRTQMRFADYAAKAASMIATAPRGVTYPMSVAATFNLAITAAVEQCAAAEQLMAFLAHGAPERMMLLLVEGAIDDETERIGALAALAEVSLLRHGSVRGRYARGDGAPARASRGARTGSGEGHSSRRGRAPDRRVSTLLSA